VGAGRIQAAAAQAGEPAVTGWVLLLYTGGILLLGILLLGIIIGSEWHRTRRPSRHRAVMSAAGRILAQDALERSMGRVQPHDQDETIGEGS
jgi:hypothetical protein